MKTTYQFAGHSDYGRRFCQTAVWVGDNAAGRAIFAWKDGLWLVHQRAAASTYYVASRQSAADLVHPRDTKDARQALANLADRLEAPCAGCGQTPQTCTCRRPWTDSQRELEQD